MIEALKILWTYNPIRNDLDAYLLDVINWGLGKQGKPNPKDFGIPEKKNSLVKTIPNKTA